MHPGSTQTFYAARRVVVIAGTIAAILAALAAWWLIDRVVLAPPMPGPDADSQVTFDYYLDARGLPRIDDDLRELFLRTQLERLASDAGFRNQLMSLLRQSTSEAQARFREHVFDAFKPLVMAEVDGYFSRQDAARAVYLDQRIAEYHRLANALEALRGEARDLAGPAGSGSALSMLLSKTTEAERQRATEYFEAMAKRVAALLGNPAMQEEFRLRTGATFP